MARVAFSFEGCQVPADIDCPPELFEVLATFGIDASAPEVTCQPSIAVKSVARRFHFSGPAYLSTFSVDGIDAAAGSVMAGLAAIKSLSVEDHMLCIHFAAAVIGGRGHLFLAPFGAGKSSLMAQLAALGADIVADDVVLLNLRDLTMTGLRMPPRLRKAFVTSASPDMKDWIAERSIFSGSRYTYLAPDILNHGPHALTDIVLLSRADDAVQAEPVLEQASPGVLIPRILWHNMSRHHAPSALAAMAAKLASGLRGSVLHAARCAAAAELLFSGKIRTMAGGGQPPLSSGQRDHPCIIRTDRGAIISDDETGRIFEINESALVMLTMLEKFDELQDILDALQIIYPDTPETVLVEQLAACARQFVDCGLIDCPPFAP